MSYRNFKLCGGVLSKSARVELLNTNFSVTELTIKIFSKSQFCNDELFIIGLIKISTGYTDTFIRFVFFLFSQKQEFIICDLSLMKKNLLKCYVLIWFLLACSLSLQLNLLLINIRETK